MPTEALRACKIKFVRQQRTLSELLDPTEDPLPKQRTSLSDERSGVNKPRTRLRSRTHGHASRLRPRGPCPQGDPKGPPRAASAARRPGGRGRDGAARHSASREFQKKNAKKQHFLEAFRSNRSPQRRARPLQRQAELVLPTERCLTRCHALQDVSKTLLLNPTWAMRLRMARHWN